MARRPARPRAALTASGERIDLSDRQLAQRVNKTRAPWQQQAWNYRELVGEIGAGLDFAAGVMSKVSYVIGQVTDSDEPLIVRGDRSRSDDKLPAKVRDAALEALDVLPFRNGYAFTGTLSTCFRVAGEAYLHGRTEADQEHWQVLSTDEVQAQGDKLGVVETPGERPRPIDPRNEVLLRLWRPHPRWKRLPDSPMRRLLDTCEDVVLIGRELRAAARSRVAANGILLIPDTLAVVRKPDGESSDFQTELEVLMLAPIADEGSAGAVVPVVLQGPAEELEKVRHITLAREDSKILIEKLDAGLARLREGMDLPTDLTGSQGSLNHWTAWQVDASKWKNYLEPHARIMVDSLTEAYLRPSLMLPENRGGWGLTREEADLVQVWYDAGNVTENANRGQDMRDLYDRGEVGGKALRAALGAGEEDAPDADEFQRMMTWKAASAITPELATALLNQALGTSGIRAVIPGQVDAPRPAAIEIPSRPPAERNRTGGPGEQPTEPVPDTGPPGISAAGTRPTERPQGCQYCKAPATRSLLWAEGKAYIPVCDQHEQRGRADAGEVDAVHAIRAAAPPPLEVITADELAEIDRALLDRLLVAADAEMLRVLERAGNRVRSQAQRNPELAARVKGLDALAVGPTLGAQGVASLGLVEDALLAAAFAVLAGKFTAWTTDAVRQAVKTLAGLLGLPLATVSRIAQAMTARIGPAWKNLETRLRQRALDKLYGRGGDELRGEVPDSLVMPGDIRSALAEVGGAPPGGVNGRGATARPDEAVGGVALGREILSVIDSKADRIGFTWKYGITPRSRQFDPHRELSGRRFESWRDPDLVPDAAYSWVGPYFQPGDHDGCMCDYVPAWALPQARDLAADVADDERPAMRAERILAEMDDAAGRVGTTAQRTRDERDRIQAVQRDWLERTA